MRYFSSNLKMHFALGLILICSACSSTSNDAAAPTKELSIKIKAAIVYKMGGPQPVARTTFYLTKESLVSLARKAGKDERIGVIGAMVNWESQIYGNSKTFDNFVKPAAITSVTTDFEGNATFKNVADGTYYLIGVTQTRSGVAIWNMPVTPSDETILVDQNNAAYTR
jgi:hypothetical protein